MLGLGRGERKLALYLHLKPPYTGLTRLKRMVHIYLYKIKIPVKSRVKAVGNIWMTSIIKLGLPGFFRYFLYNINKLISYL